jgi:hypothetical protein
MMSDDEKIAAQPSTSQIALGHAQLSLLAILRLPISYFLSPSNSNK